MSTAHGSPSFIPLPAKQPSPGPCLLELLRHVLVFLRRFPGDLTAEGTNKVGCSLRVSLASSLVLSGELWAQQGGQPANCLRSLLPTLVGRFQATMFQAAPWILELAVRTAQITSPPG